jgi:hypothetical protein
MGTSISEKHAGCTHTLENSWNTAMRRLGSSLDVSQSKRREKCQAHSLSSYTAISCQ